MTCVEPIHNGLNKDLDLCLQLLDKQVDTHCEDIINQIFKALLATLSEQIDKNHILAPLDCVKTMGELTKDLNQKQLKCIFKVFLFVFRQHKEQINLLPWHGLKKIEDFLEICLYQAKIISDKNNRKRTKKDFNGEHVI